MRTPVFVASAALFLCQTARAFLVWHSAARFPGALPKHRIGEAQQVCCLLQPSAGLNARNSNEVEKHFGQFEIEDAGSSDFRISRRLALPTILLAGQALLRKPASAFEVKQEAFDGGSRLSVPSQWQRSASQEPGGAVFSDPVAGQTLRFLAVTARPTAAATIADLGRVDAISFASALGRPELARADMIAAGCRNQPSEPPGLDGRTAARLTTTAPARSG